MWPWEIQIDNRLLIYEVSINLQTFMTLLGFFYLYFLNHFKFVLIDREVADLILLACETHAW